MKFKASKIGLEENGKKMFEDKQIRLQGKTRYTVKSLCRRFERQLNKCLKPGKKMYKLHSGKRLSYYDRNKRIRFFL